MNSRDTNQIVQQSLKKRYAAERRFKRFGLASIILGISVLLFMFIEITLSGLGAFRQTYLELEIRFDLEVMGIPALEEPFLSYADFDALVRKALLSEFPDVTLRKDKRKLYGLMSVGAGYKLRQMLLAQPNLVGQTRTVSLLVDDEFDMYVKGKASERLTETQTSWMEALIQRGKVKVRFNRDFFTQGDSSEPEQAGILGALMGSLLTMMVTLVLSFPIGVAAAIYLEEFAGKSRINTFIEVNINNLAAVPSIIYGLLGLAIFINLFGMPRSVPLVAGFVLSLMTLPTIIISSRAAIQSVPPSIREAALGMGASQMQVIMGHVLILALPGMLTGTIIGMARALGESAPLLLIGMIAFIVDVPAGLEDPATVLPVQIYLWADSMEQAFVERTSAAIMVLLLFLIVMNTLAVWMRRKVERRW